MQDDLGAAFRALHRKGDPFVLANAWDEGSARVLKALGAQAIGTSSAAHAFTLGRPDGGHVTRDEALAHAEAAGGGDGPAGVGRFRERLRGGARDGGRDGAAVGRGGARGDLGRGHGAAGRRGLSFDLAVERIRAAAAAARALPATSCWWRGRTG
jgi:hypothetical protein